MYYFRDDLKKKKPVKINVPHKKIMMCLNESSLNPFELIGQKVVKKLHSVPLNHYFNNITSKLRKELAKYVGVFSNCLAFGNGADEMLYYIFTSVRNNNDSYAVSLAPSYFDYQSYTSAVGLKIKFLDLDKNFDFNVKEYLQLSNSKNCKLSILCNPNNPTGNLLDTEKVIEIIQRTDHLVLIDETYFEFSGITMVNLINRFPNLIVVRSFSKSFSIAGLRFGYVVSQPANIKELEKVITAFHLNLLTQTFVVTILENKELFLAHNMDVVKFRDQMYEELQKIPEVKVYESTTNFLIFNVGEKSADLFKYLSKNGIAVRPVWTHPLLKNCLRVSISSEENNRLFLKYIKSFVKKMNNIY